MKLLVKYNFGKLLPIFDSDLENLKSCKLKTDVVYEVEIKQKRNYEFHKKYFALLQLCFQNQEHFELFDDMRDYITCKSGFYRKVILPNGYEDIKPKSISFSKMDNIEFQQLYNETINQICIFLQVKEEDLMQEIANFI